MTGGGGKTPCDSLQLLRLTMHSPQWASRAALALLGEYLPSTTGFPAKAVNSTRAFRNRHGSLGRRLAHRTARIRAATELLRAFF